MSEKESIKEEIEEYIKESSRTFVELEDKFPLLRSKSGNDTHVELHYPYFTTLLNRKELLYLN